jgi:hypothetical protein
MEKMDLFEINPNSNAGDLLELDEPISNNLDYVTQGMFKCLNEVVLDRYGL